MRLARVMGVTLLCGVAAAAACSSSPTYGSTGGGGNNPGPDTVFMAGTAFNPATRTVAKGATVTWLNHDPFGHTVTYSSGPGVAFSSDTLAAQASYQVKFDSAGTYTYYCRIHGTPSTGMRGSIVVQ